MNSPYAIIEYNISQDKDEHVLSSSDLADLIEEVIDCTEQDKKNNTKVFISKYKRLIEDLRKI